MNTTTRARVTLRVDDLSGTAVRELVAAHLRGMHENSPPESVHALDIEALRRPEITFWSAWWDTELAGIGAVKRLDAENGELKSMRVIDRFLGRGIGRALVQRILQTTREQGMTALWLETGSTPEFTAARRLYESEGFTVCEPFGDYRPDPLSVFMTRAL